MIDKFCDFITKKIKEKVENIDEEKELIINFGIKLLFGELPKIFILFIIGIFLNVGWYTVLIFFLLAPYRSFTGGFHLKTHLGCMASTTILYILPIILAKYIPISQNYVHYIMVVIVSVFSVILIAKYAPADTENIPIISKKEKQSKRIKAYIFLTVLLSISIFAPNKIISYMIIYGIFFQNFTITPIAYKLTKCKHGYEIYTEEIV